MTEPQSNESFLLAQFRDFYTEVIRLKQMIKESGGMTPAEAALVEPPANGNGNGNGNGHGNVTAQTPAARSEITGNFVWQRKDHLTCRSRHA